MTSCEYHRSTKIIAGSEAKETVIVQVRSMNIEVIKSFSGHAGGFLVFEKEPRGGEWSLDFHKAEN